MAASLKVCTAPAMAPISSLRPTAGISTLLSPWACLFMAPVIAVTGLAMAADSSQPSATETRAARMPPPIITRSAMANAAASSGISAFSEAASASEICLTSARTWKRRPAETTVAWADARRAGSRAAATWASHCAVTSLAACLRLAMAASSWGVL